MVVALLLPERCPCSAEPFVGLPRSRTLQLLQEHRNIRSRRDQQMNMVRHDDPGMKNVTATAALLNRIDHALRDARSLQIHRTGAVVVEQSVHIYKRLSRTHRLLGKPPPGRKAAVESKCDKQRLFRYIEVRQMTP